MTGFKHFARLGPVAFGVASVALLALAIGCGGEEGEETADSEPAAAPVERKQGTREVPLAGGSVAQVTTGELPTGYPPDLPVPPDSEPKNALFIPGQGGLATFVSQTSREELSNYFKQELPVQGWSLGDDKTDSGRITITATKAGRTVQVLIVTNESGSEISIRVQGK